MIFSLNWHRFRRHRFRRHRLHRHRLRRHTLRRHRLQSNRWVGYERNHRKSRHGYPMFRITCSLPYIRHRSWRWVNPFLQHSKRQLFQKFSCIGFIRKRNATRGLLGYLITLKHKQVILTKNKAWAVVCTYYKKTKRARD